MTAEVLASQDGTGRAWSSRVTLGAVAHTEDLEVMRPAVEPASAVTLQLTRLDEVSLDGAVTPGAPELVVTAADAPLGIGDVDDLIARLTAARGRMLAATPDLSARPGHRADAESP